MPLSPNCDVAKKFYSSRVTLVKTKNNNKNYINIPLGFGGVNLGVFSRRNSLNLFIKLLTRTSYKNQLE